MSDSPTLDPAVIAALVEYAESDAPVDDIEAGHGVELRGAAAAEAGRAMLARGGRPAVGETHATGRGHSPKRQVRLSPATSDRLDAYAAAQGTTPSAVIRDALDAYLTEHTS